jgi:hypothetical protein
MALQHLTRGLAHDRSEIPYAPFVPQFVAKEEAATVCVLGMDGVTNHDLKGNVERQQNFVAGIEHDPGQSIERPGGQFSESADLP